MSASTPYFLARSRYANLSRSVPPDDPRLIALRQERDEAYLVYKVAMVLDRGPALTPDLRAKLEAVIAERAQSQVAA